MIKANRNWKTPLGYYEKAITELIKAQEEINIELKNIQSIHASHLELQEVKKELHEQGIQVQKISTELHETKTNLKTTEFIASVAQSELKMLKIELQNMNEQQLKSNKQTIENLAKIKEQLFERQFQAQNFLQLEEFNAFKTVLTQALSDLQLKFSNLVPPALVSSATSVDYRLLSNLLAAEDWQKADEETRFLICKISNQGDLRQRFLNVADIKKFPWQDLRIINQLWIEYSKGHFGFSVQKQIWQTVEVANNHTFEVEKSLSRRVGWRVNDNWLNYSELTFNLNAPKGHLPSTLHLLGRGSGRVEHRIRLFFSHRQDL